MAIIGTAKNLESSFQFPVSDRNFGAPQGVADSQFCAAIDWHSGSIHTMAQRYALLFLGLASPAMLVCSWFPGFVSELSFVLLVMAFPAALIALAVARDGKLGPLRVPLVVLTLMLEGCGVAMLLLRGQVLEGPWFGGFPAGTAVQIYGLWLGPLFLVALAYGWTFDCWELREEDLRRFDARRNRSDGDHQ